MADELTIRMAVTGVAAVEAGIKRVEDAMGRTKTALNGFNKQIGASIGLINGFSSIASAFGNQTMKDLAASADKAALAVGNLKNAASLLTSVRTGAWAVAAGTAMLTLATGMELLQTWQKEADAKKGLESVNRKLADSIEEVTMAQMEQGLISEKQAEDFLTQAILAKDAMSGVSPEEMSGRLTGIARILFANQGSAQDEAKAGEIMQKIRRAQIAAGQQVNVRGLLAEYDAVQEANAVRAEIDKLKLTGEEKRNLILQNEMALRAQLSAIAAANQPAPFGFRENMLANLETVRKQFDDTGKMIADTLNNTIGTAVNSISQQFTQLILGAQTWGETLRNIGLSVVTELIQSIIRMGAQFVLQHVLMRGAMQITTALGIALGAKQTASTIAQEGAKAPALATNAASASIGSYGAAAVIGGIAAVAALGLILAAALGAFETGGYTGNGGTGDVAGVVHGREFVFSAPAVERVGLGNLQAMHDSAVGGGGGGAAGGGGGAVHVGMINSAQERREFLRRDPEVRKILIDLVTGAKQEIGIA